MSGFGPGPAIAPPLPIAEMFGGFWVRFVAYVIDGVILGVLNAVMIGSVGSGDLDTSLGPPSVQFGTTTVVSLVSFLVPAIYTVGFWASGGATPGKMVFRMRIVRSQDGGPISRGQAIGRFFGYFVSGLIFALGFVWIAFDGRKQGWHDKLASTVFIRPANSGVAVLHG